MNPCWTFRVNTALASCALLAAGSLGPPAHAGPLRDVNELAKRVASDASPGAGFGRSVSVSADLAVVGAYNAGSSGAFFYDGPGAAYVVQLDGGAWIERAVLTPSDGATGDQFGYAVAISGDVIVAGARGDDDMGPVSGSAYVFRFDGDSWIEEDKLVASDGRRHDEFGTAAGVSGNVAVIGAPQNSLTESGYAWVYRYNGADWVEEAKLIAFDGEGGARDQFGISVAVSGDVAVVGAWNHGNTGADFFDGTGAAYVFRFDGANWVPEAKLVSTSPLPGQRDRFGKAVSISEDAAVIVVGTEPISGAPPVPVGAAYVFRFDGATWNSEAKLVASDAEGGDRFGSVVSISGDVVLAGAWGEYSSASPCTQDPPFGGVCNSGSAYVYTFDGGGWPEQAKLTATDIAEGDNFAWSASISGDAAVIGSWRDADGGTDAGSAYVFRGLSDCNGNGTLDACDIATGASQDGNGNGVPDECDCPGDVNNNGFVDLTDLGVLLGNFGTGTLPSEGDIDGDGDIDLTDLGLLLANFGASCP